MQDQEKWRKGLLRAEIWFCGDEICDCHQALISHVAPNLEAGYPWVQRKNEWAGTFVSEPDAEQMETIRQELRDAAARYGIPIDENLFGERVL